MEKGLLEPKKKRERLCLAWPKCECILQGHESDCRDLDHSLLRSIERNYKMARARSGEG